MNQESEGGSACPQADGWACGNALWTRRSTLSFFPVFLIISMSEPMIEVEGLRLRKEPRIYTNTH